MLSPDASDGSPVGGLESRRCPIAKASVKIAATKDRPPRAPLSEPPVRKDNTEARQVAIQIARMLADTRCHQVAVLDVAGISPVTDYFVVATGSSARQMRTAVDAAEEVAEQAGYGKLSRDGDESANWIVLDCFDVIVHCFTQEARSYYDVDGMWGDAVKVEWERA
jgi:ribosome-associated protein